MLILNFSRSEDLYQALSLQLFQKLKISGEKTWGLATGKTMEELYLKLVRLKEQHSLDVSRLMTFNLDEYVGLDKNHPQSFAYYMYHHFFLPFNLSPSQTQLLNGKAKDLNLECNRYEQLLKKFPLDLQLLGLGLNGHVAFNEPGSRIDSQTRVVKLSEKTIEQNHLTGITEALTMGLASILRSKELYLVVQGESKKDIFRQFLLDDQKRLPVSHLKNHPNLFIYVDEIVLSSLSSLEREKFEQFIRHGDHGFIAQ